MSSDEVTPDALIAARAQCPRGKLRTMTKRLLPRFPRLAFTAALLAVLFGVFIAIHPRGLSVYVLTIWANQGTLLALCGDCTILRHSCARDRLCQ